MNTKVAFFKEAIKNFKTTGTIMPSSKFLIKRMLKEIDFKKINVLVEFGAGNGIITKSILKKMHKDAVLFCFEINPEFYKHLKLINDNRLIVVNQSAQEVKNVLNKHNIASVDCIISSLPLTMLPAEISKSILHISKNLLKNESVFIQYQYSINFFKIFKQVFGKNNVFLAFELMNIPPAFIYKCKKNIIAKNS